MQNHTNFIVSYVTNAADLNALTCGNYIYNPIQCVLTGAGSLVLFARIVRRVVDYDHIQIGTLPVPVKSALKSKSKLTTPLEEEED